MALNKKMKMTEYNMKGRQRKKAWKKDNLKGPIRKMTEKMKTTWKEDGGKLWNAKERILNNKITCTEDDYNGRLVLSHFLQKTKDSQFHIQ